MTTNNWLLIYSTSPVQSFITSSRKTRDFFLSSYILSYITFKLLHFLTETVKDTELIYPVLEEQGIYKAFKGEKVTLHDLLVANFPNKFVVFIKNRDKAEIEQIRSKILSEFNNTLNLLYEESFEEVLSNLCEEASKTKPEAFKLILDKNFEKLCDYTDQSKLHFFTYFQPFLVAKKVKNLTDYKSEYNLTEYLLGLRKTLRRYDGGEDGFKTFTVDDNKQIKEFYPNGCTVCGERLHTVLNFKPLAETADLDENERLCGVCLTKRYSGYFYGKYFKDKVASQMSSQDKEVLKFLREITSEVWNTSKDWIVPFTRFPSTNEVSLSREKFEFIKILIERKTELRNFILNFPIKELKELMKAFPSAFTYALNPLYVGKLWKQISLVEEELRTPLKYLIFLHAEYLSTDFLENTLKKLRKEGIPTKQLNALETFTGSLKNLFEDVKRTTGINFERLFNKAPYFAIIFSDGDNIGKILGGDPNYVQEEFSKDFHYKFSANLSEYATTLAKELEEGFTKVVYAGGDDLYAFSHLSDVVRVLENSSNLYRCILNTLLKNPSTSAGVVIGHATVHLKFLTRKVHEAEKTAKNLFGRNAFVIKVISRSGEESFFGSKFTYPDLPCNHQPLEVLKELIKLYGGFDETKTSEEGPAQKPSKLSSRLPYTLREIAKKFPVKYEMDLLPKMEGESEEQYKNRILEKLKSQEGFILSLLKREIRRKVQTSGEEAKKVTEKVFGMLSDLLKAQVREHLMSPAEALNNIASLLYVARFIAQGGDRQ